MPGVVLFAAELARATGETKWRRLAQGGARHLAAEMEGADPAAIDAGLYTGLGGLALSLHALEDLGDDSARAPARRALTLLRDRAKPRGNGVTWTGSHDIISGSAGTGLLLLEAHRRSADTAWLDLAARAGRHLVAAGEPARGGLMWFPGRDSNRNYPKFSHGTAGVAYFSATLHRRPPAIQPSSTPRSPAPATSMRSRSGTTAPPGFTTTTVVARTCSTSAGATARPARPGSSTGLAPRSPATRAWSAWVDSLTRGTLAAGVPERRTDGFWNNISQCCGNVGVGEYFLALARSPLSGSDMVRRVVDDTVRRGTRDRAGLRWVQAENRVEPENLVAQTGYMQQAGVGTFLLRLDAHEQRGAAGPAQLPDSPFRN